MGANPAGLIAPSQHPRDLIQHILDPCPMQSQRAFSDRSRTQQSTDLRESCSLIKYQLGWVCYYVYRRGLDSRYYWRLTPAFGPPMPIQ